MRNYKPSLVAACALAAALALPGVAVAAVPGIAAHNDDWHWWDYVDADEETEVVEEEEEAVAEDEFDGAGSGWWGGSWKWNRHQVTQEQVTELRIRDLEIDEVAISPNEDGEADFATVSFYMRRNSVPVQVDVIDANGALVHKLGSATRSGYTDFVWDATNEAHATVADGAYRVLLHKGDIAAALAETDPLILDILVDQTAPELTAQRPTLGQIKGLSVRAAKLRDQLAKWARAQESEHRGHGWRKKFAEHPGRAARSVAPRAAKHNDKWDEKEKAWAEFWQENQLRIPITFTTAEAATIDITARVGDKEDGVETWRDAGRQTVAVALPKYISGGKAYITVSATDDAGNARKHTIVFKMPVLPKPKRTTTRTVVREPDPTQPVGGGGPFPDWMDPLVVRAVADAGLPASWAKSKAWAQLMKNESSFNPKAQNPASTAFGVGQFLDQTWATVGCKKTTDAQEQIRCMGIYILRRYRTPERALAWWNAQSPHWY